MRLACLLLLHHPVPAVRILIVEDDEAQRACLSELLTRAGFVVSETEDGAHALEQIDVTDCLITDLGLPVMCGAELIRRTRDQHPSLPIIAISGLPFDRTVTRQASVCLTKPFEPAVLLSCILEFAGVKAARE